MYIRDLSSVLSSSYWYWKRCHVLSCEFRTGVPWQLLYADDLAVIANTLAWKEGMENKGLRVNMKKTKFMVT